MHRKNEFRGALDSVEKASHLAKQGRIKLLTKAEVIDVSGNGVLNAVTIKNTDGQKEKIEVKTDYFISLFGLSPKLGPIGN